MASSAAVRYCFPTDLESLTTHSRHPQTTIPLSLDLLRRLCDGVSFIAISLVAQLLIAGIQLGLDAENIDFPASILAMAVVFVIFSVIGAIIPGVENWYWRWLKRPTDLLNRHMSIGFIVPVVMICRGPISDGGTIGMVIICFVIMNFLNTLLAYIITLPLQYLMIRHDPMFGADGSPDPEKGISSQSASIRTPARSISENSAMDSSIALGFSTPGGVTPLEKSTQEVVRFRTRILQFLLLWALNNPLLVLFSLLTVVVGLPLRLATKNDVALATPLLFSIWLTTLAIQSAIKSPSSILPCWLRTLLSGLLNPVLWTSLSMIAYLLLDSSLSHRPLPTMLDTFQTNNTLITILNHQPNHSPSESPASPKTLLAAGDLATTLLNSGLVAWGLKLYEHRSHLISRAGLSVFTVSSLLAISNVTLGPLFASQALHMRPAARAIAFAARSVTIALGDPVMGMLGGDQGLSAAMVVVSGIGYQMGLGFGMGAWVERWVRRWMSARIGKSQGNQSAVGRENQRGGNEAQPARSQEGEQDVEDEAAASRRRVNDPMTVAAGVTVGVNAAAMGTAYLYEAKSDAAPHAALSMMAFGIMMVVFASIPPLAQRIVRAVQGG